MNKRAQTDFLFAQPSFLSGAARVFDLGGNFDVYNDSDDPDTLALRADWFVVGDDMREALRTFTLEHPEIETA